jgi:hypothetical protein
VTKSASYEALNLIARGKLTFDERVVLHCVLQVFSFVLVENAKALQVPFSGALSHSLSLILIHSHSLSLTLTYSHSLPLTLTNSHSLSFSITLNHSHSLGRASSHTIENAKALQVPRQALCTHLIECIYQLVSENQLSHKFVNLLFTTTN